MKTINKTMIAVALYERIHKIKHNTLFTLYFDKKTKKEVTQNKNRIRQYDGSSLLRDTAAITVTKLVTPMCTQEQDVHIW